MAYPPYFPAQSTEPGTIYRTPKGVKAELIKVTYPTVTFRQWPFGKKTTVDFQEFFRMFREVVYP